MRLAPGFLVAAALSLIPSPLSGAQAGPGGDRHVAEIVALAGPAEVRPETVSVWSQARVKQELFPGNFVRTGDAGRIAILFLDETQVRLNQNSQLQIKPPRDPGATGATLLRLNAGRAWAQSRRPPEQLRMETPAAVAAIRGTDWVIEVGPDGTATLTVLSGEVEFSNDLGRVSVKAGEQSVAQVGKAPMKRLLANPRARVQWVTAYAVDPLRHIALADYRPAAAARTLAAAAGDDAATRVRRGNALFELGRREEAEREYRSALEADPGSAAARLGLACAALGRGDAAGAVAHLDAAGASEPELLALVQAAAHVLSGSPKTAALLLEDLVRRGGLRQPAALLLLSDMAISVGDLPAALARLAEAGMLFPDDARVASQRARALLIDDRAEESRAQVDRALALAPAAVEPRLAQGDLARFEGDARAAEAAFAAAVAAKPADDRGWYGRGVVLSESGRTFPARADLTMALFLNPAGAGYRGELATLETFADRYAVAAAEFRAALAVDPADYVALTGLGLLQLKRGDASGALESFLRAGVIEPRYARAHTWGAVALYQLGRGERALEELARASELDPRDPLPHLFASMIQRDRLEAQRAVAQSREALRLMPYLKSLDQVASDQKGAANLGSSLAFFGLEEWAQAYGHESSSPYWGGSHLFLGDRYPDGFAKNSEFAQGYLADPVAFGASNRFQTLLVRPGTYATAEISYAAQDAARWTESGATLNGLSTALFPVAYFVNASGGWFHWSDPGFAWESDEQSAMAALGAKPVDGLDVFFLGTHDSGDGEIVYEDPHGTLPYDTRSSRLDVGAHYRFAPDSQLWLKAAAGKRAESWRDMADVYEYSDTVIEDVVDSDSVNDGSDVQLRHTSTRGRHELTWGFEWGESNAGDNYRWHNFVDEAIPETRLEYNFRDISLDGYLSDRVRVGSRWLVQADLRLQRREHSFKAAWRPPDSPWSVIEEKSESTTKGNASLGLVCRPAEGLVLRLVHQSWQRPFSASTLGPVATAGVVLDDRFVSPGGTLERTALRGEWEIDESTFVSAGLDHKVVANGESEGYPLETPGLESLGALRNVQIYNRASDTFLEGAPLVEAGRLWSAGVAVNRILARRWSAFARYTYSDGRNTSDDFEGCSIPYVARHMAAAGTTVVLPQGLHLGATAVYQTRRYEDEGNEYELEAGWNGALAVYGESRDKRWALYGGVVNLLSADWGTGYYTFARFRW